MSDVYAKWDNLCEKLKLAQSKETEALLAITDKFHQDISTTDADHDTLESATENLNNIKKEMASFVKHHS